MELQIIKGGGLYKIVNNLDGKCYIGAAKNFERRWSRHLTAYRANKKCALYDAFRKYGLENFSFVPLVVAQGKEYLEELEMKAIKAFNTRHPEGYNMTDGGPGFVNLDAESKAIHREGLKKAWKNQSPEQRLARIQKVKDWRRNNEIEFSVEGRKSISIKTKERWCDPAYKIEISKKIRDALNIPETKAKHASAIKAALQTQKHRQFKAKMTESLWQDSNYRKKVISRLKEKYSTPEAKKKRSDAMKKVWAVRKAQNV